MHTRIVEANFQRCESDISFYWKRDGEDFVIVEVYVDDLLTTDTNAAAVDSFFDILASLSIKDLRSVSKFLGIRIELEVDGVVKGSGETLTNRIFSHHGYM